MFIHTFNIHKLCCPVRQLDIFPGQNQITGFVLRRTKDIGCQKYRIVITLRILLLRWIFSHSNSLCCRHLLKINCKSKIYHEKYQSHIFLKIASEKSSSLWQNDAPFPLLCSVFKVTKASIGSMDKYSTFRLTCITLMVRYAN